MTRGFGGGYQTHLPPHQPHLVSGNSIFSLLCDAGPTFAVALDGTPVPACPPCADPKHHPSCTACSPRWVYSASTRKKKKNIKSNAS